MRKIENYYVVNRSEVPGKDGHWSQRCMDAPLSFFQREIDYHCGSFSRMLQEPSIILLRPYVINYELENTDKLKKLKFVIF